MRISGTTGAPDAWRRLSLIASLISLVFSTAAATSPQQAPPRDTRTTTTTNAAPTGTGVLGGTVTGAEDNRPVRHAHIVLIGTTTGIVKVSATDADGRFTFSNLPVDRYTVGASKPPYLGTIAGAKRPGRTGTPIAIAAGQKVTNVAIRMPMGGAIAGTILDDKGQPAMGAFVGLMQRRMQGTERTLVTVGRPTPTDDAGRYRFHGLLPGEYVVVAEAGRPITRALSAAEVDAAVAGAAGPAPAPPAPIRNAPVYFPGTPRGNEAMAIVLGPAEERANVDFRVEPVPVARIEGSVADANGQPAGGMSLLVLGTDGPLSTAASIRVGPDGRFTVPNVVPGTHELLINGIGPLAGQYARTVVQTAGVDAFGVQLTMRPALTFRGRLVFEAAPAPAVANRRIPIRALESRASNAVISSTDQSGLFTVTSVIPGRYVLGGPLAFGPTADTMIWTLKSVMVDGRDLTDLPIEIADTPPKDVVVTYTDRWQELSGRLQSQSGAPVSDFTIVVFPEDTAYWIHGTRRIVTARPGTDGRFNLSGKGLTTLPPGKYLLAAVTDISRDEQFDPAFLAQIVPAAISITLAAGEKKVQDLAIK